VPCDQLAGAPKNGTAKCAPDCMSWDKSDCSDEEEESQANEPEGNGPVIRDDDSGCALTLI